MSRLHPTTSRATRTTRARGIRGFTLIELLVVMGVIAIVLVIAVPAFKAVTSGRKESAARNLVSAALSRARAEAIKLEQPAGVFFWKDPVSERSKMAIVVLDEDETDPNRYDEYKAYLDGPAYDYQGSNPDPLGPDVRGEPDMFGDRVIGFADDTNLSTGGVGGYDDTALLGADYSNAFDNRPIVLTWQRTTLDVTKSIVTGGGPPPGENVDTFAGVMGGTAGSRPDGSGNGAYAIAFPNPRVNAELTDRFEDGFGPTDEAWVLYREPTLDRIRKIEVVELPAGIDLQLITGTGLDGDSRVLSALANTGGGFYERYVQAGAILFSPSGRLSRKDYLVLPNSDLGGTIDTGTALVLRSLVGVSLFDSEAFKKAQSDGTARHWLGNVGSSVVGDEVIAAFATSQGDGNFAFPPADRPTSPDNEYAEERWIDANTTPLLVNRVTGQLSDAE